MTTDRRELRVLFQDQREMCVTVDDEAVSVFEDIARQVSV